MRSPRFYLCGLLLLAMPLSAGDASFHRVVQILSKEYHAKPASGMGFLSCLARCFTPSGVHRFSMAVIDEAPAELVPDQDEGLEQRLRTVIDPSYSPMLRVVSNKDHERTFIYLRDAGKRFDLLLISAERREAVVMGMRLDPVALNQWMEDPEGMAHRCQHQTDSN